MSEPNDSHWLEYTELQRVKHELLRRYLGAWFGILGSTHGRIAYIETHAGRGRFQSGDAGSPVVALKTLLEHRHRGAILRNANALFAFVEADATNAESLRQEITSLGTLPDGVKCTVAVNDYATEITGLLEYLRRTDRPPTPMFVFADPFGFSLRIDLLRELLREPKCELLLNFMWRNVSQALSNPSNARNMDDLFGSGNWESLSGIEDYSQRCDAAIERLTQRLGSRHSRSIKMRGTNQAVKYALVHMANNELALRKMNEVLWALCPTGNFSVNQSDDPNQQVIFSPEPDLRPLGQLLWDTFNGHVVSTEAVDAIGGRFWLPKHCHQLVKKWHESGAIQLVGSPKLVFSHNPQIKFVRRPDPVA